MSKKAESDEQMLDRIKEKIEHPKPSGPWEHDMMRKAVVEAVSNPKYVDDKRLKWVHSMIFGTMTETVEVRQIQEMMLSMDKQFDAVNKKVNQNQVDNKSEHRLLKYGILGLAIASGVFGILSEEVIIWIARIFGL